MFDIDSTKKVFKLSYLINHKKFVFLLDVYGLLLLISN